MSFGFNNLAKPQLLYYEKKVEPSVLCFDVHRVWYSHIQSAATGRPCSLPLPLYIAPVIKAALRNLQSHLPIALFIRYPPYCCR